MNNGIHVDFAAAQGSGEAARLRLRLQEVQAERDSLEDEEPKDPMSEEYEEWLEKCDILEDEMDDILDRLEELEG